MGNAFIRFHLSEVFGFGGNLGCAAADTAVIGGEVSFKPAHILVSIGSVPVQFHIAEHRGFVQTVSGIADDLPFSAAFFEKMNAARPKGFLIAARAIFRRHDVAMRDNRRNGRARYQIVIMR